MYEVGDVLQLGMDITGADDNPANAGAASLVLVKPDKTTESLTPNNPVVGQYRYDYTATAPGTYVAVWTFTGANAGSESQLFDVRSHFEGMTSLDDVKLTLGIKGSSTHDEHLKAYIAAATGIVERHTGEIMVRRSFVESYASDDGRALLIHGPNPVVTGVTYSAGAYPLGGLTSAGRWVRGLPYGSVTITYTAGYETVPSHYALAARLIVQRLWQQSQRGTTTLNDTFGPPDEAVGDESAMPRMARQLLGPPAPLVA